MSLWEIFIIILKTWFVLQLIGIGLVLLRALKPVLVLGGFVAIAFPIMWIAIGLLKFGDAMDKLGKPSKTKTVISYIIGIGNIIVMIMWLFNCF